MWHLVGFSPISHRSMRTFHAWKINIRCLRQVRWMDGGMDRREHFAFGVYVGTTLRTNTAHSFIFFVWRSMERVLNSFYEYSAAYVLIRGNAEMTFFDSVFITIPDPHSLENRIYSEILQQWATIKNKTYAQIENGLTPNKSSMNIPTSLLTILVYTLTRLVP